MSIQKSSPFPIYSKILHFYTFDCQNGTRSSKNNGKENEYDFILQFSDFFCRYLATSLKFPQQIMGEKGNLLPVIKRE
jgi:hypothetical protein